MGLTKLGRVRGAFAATVNTMLAITWMTGSCGGVVSETVPTDAGASRPDADASASESTRTDAEDGPAPEQPAACARCGLLEECWEEKLCVAKQVPIEAQDPGLGLIDVTEVTRSQYASWLSLGPDASEQLQQCSWNTSFVPPDDCLKDPRVCSGMGCENHPQVCVDWCDAYAYCRAIGKRLCGRLGGGSLDYGAYASATASQWFAACSFGGSTLYPYGDSFVKDACQEGQYSTAPVASHAQCRTPSGAFDLSGNASEWEDACAWDAAEINCRWRGGNFDNTMPLLVSCWEMGHRRPDAALHGGGLRCCSNP